MIQEIYDYLWIRNVLISLDAKNLANNIENIEEYRFVLTCMNNLLNQEDFPLIVASSLDKISEFIQIFRFKYKDTDINNKTNFIIEKLNEYKAMNNQTKRVLIEKFYCEEAKDRNLPLRYNNSETINCLIQNDIHIYRDIFSNVNGNEAIALTETDIIDYISLTNLIMNRYIGFFEQDKRKDSTVNNLNQLVNIKQLPFDVRLNIKKTVRKLSKAGNKVKRLSF